MGFDAATVMLHATHLLAWLRECVLIDIDEPSCEVYRRGDNGLWVLHPVANADTMRLATGEAAVPCAASPREQGLDDEVGQPGDWFLSSACGSISRLRNQAIPRPPAPEDRYCSRRRRAIAPSTARPARAMA